MKYLCDKIATNFSLYSWYREKIGENQSFFRNIWENVKNREIKKGKLATRRGSISIEPIGTGHVLKGGTPTRHNAKRYKGSGRNKVRSGGNVTYVKTKVENKGSWSAALRLGGALISKTERQPVLPQDTTQSVIKAREGIK